LRVSAALRDGATLTLVIVAAGPGHHLRVHDAKPEERDRGERVAAGIAARQTRQFGEVTQGLIGAQGVGVVIRMALEMEEQQVRNLVVRVPRMARLHRLVAAVRQLAAQKAVVLDVVGLCQAVPADEMMDDQERHHLPAEQGDAGDGDDEGDGIALQDFVLDRPEALALLRQAQTLVLDAAAEGAR